ncbi:glycine cleavage system aminomethyltransferase GcvT [Tropicimonas sp. IMCC34043]|uniref:glycine cleavage system aminomethyltransferase GcvT n=1 Tax=Tropicimonas sp. IMCC34043 TaxID=2248760 RepID=UPI000E27DDAA|nr:glycine cleavage system aminomethyltransferase GcvT [Tropicimonas sp. IMCC34043]
MAEDLATTPLHALHLELGARMVPFAGYEMPVQYPSGVLKEHLHTRAAAGLFDVSHMGQILLKGDNPAAALERLMPQAIVGLKPGRQRYGFFTSETGGILDDLMVANRGDHLFLVVNAANKAEDAAHLRRNLFDLAMIEVENRALLALQGPAAAAALARTIPLPEMKFMDVAVVDTGFGTLWISRSGYTGEDGFEISVKKDHAEVFARALLAQPEVLPVGLGARDSLRLEAGLCLHGHDITPATDPVEAALTWAIQAARRPGGARAGGYPGADRIAAQLQRPVESLSRVRVGLLPEGRAPMREGVEIFEDEAAEHPVGRITSGTFGPTLGQPVAMGYVTGRLAGVGTRLWGELRGRRQPVTVAGLPFVAASYKR